MAESLLLPRLTPPVAPVRERRSATAQAGGASTHRVSIPVDYVPFHEDPPALARRLKPTIVTKNADPKVVLRRRGIQARRKLTTEQRDDASLLISDLLVRQPTFQRAKCVATYLPAEDEVNSWPLIERAWRMKKRVFAPIVKKNRHLHFCELGPNSRLSMNQFGLREPREGCRIDSRRLDLVIVPLVAFDDGCNRIGMGGGYYDRTFSFLRARQSFRKPKLIGVAFERQRVEHIPASPWDIPLFQVITELGGTCRDGVTTASHA